MKKKILSIIMTAVLGLTVLTGCGGDSADITQQSDNTDSASQEEETDAGAPDANTAVDGEGYEVNFAYIVSNTMADQDKVNQALSDLAMEEINMTVNVIALTYVDALNQIPLMLASGSGLDIFPSWSNTVGSFIDSGYVEDLAPYHDQMVNTMEWMSVNDLECCMVQGVQWGVPQNKERASCEAIFMRKDILDELGITVKGNETWEEVTNIFAQVHEAYPDMVVLGGASYEAPADMGDVAFMCDTLGNELGVLADNGAEAVVVNQFETEDWREAVEVTRQWYEAGYLSKDMATSQDSGETMIAGGNTFAFANNWKPDSLNEKKSTTGYELVDVMISEPMTATQFVGGSAYAVASIAEDPEKAVLFLDWLVGSAEANDLLNWGIEGEHWIVDEDGNAVYPEGVDGASCGYHNGWGFIMPNQFAGHLWEGTDTDLYDQYQDYKNNAAKSVAYGFNFDSTNVVNEVIACQAVLDQYIAPICTGSVEPETAIAEMNEALYNAGLQTIIDEKQAQLDAWLTEH